MKVNYLFSSTESYLPLTSPVIEQGLRVNGIPDNEVYYVINDSADSYEGQNLFQYTGLSMFEWASIQAILDTVPSDVWWFIMHDTVSLGPNFKTLVHQKLNANDRPIVKLTPFISNSMGVIHDNVIRTHRIKLEGLLAELKELDDPIERKKWCIGHENWFLELEDNPAVFQNDVEEQRGTTEIYGSIRLVEYFHSIDLTKYKKNYHGPTNVSITI